METNNTYLDTDSGDLIRDTSIDLLTRVNNMGNGSSDNITITINTNREKISDLIKNFSDYADKQKSKEFYFISAIRNLIKKNSFLQLTMQLVENQITEEEYASQIESHPENYIVDINQINSANDIEIVCEIIKSIGLNFSIDEVSEVFSLDLEDYEEKIKKLK